MNLKNKKTCTPNLMKMFRDYLSSQLLWDSKSQSCFPCSGRSSEQKSLASHFLLFDHVDYETSCLSSLELTHESSRQWYRNPGWLEKGDGGLAIERDHTNARKIILSQKRTTTSLLVLTVSKHPSVQYIKASFSKIDSNKDWNFANKKKKLGF